MHMDDNFDCEELIEDVKRHEIQETDAVETEEETWRE